MSASFPISTLKGIGTSYSKEFKKLGIKTIQDLLLTFPRRHIDFTKMQKLSQVVADEVVTVSVTIKTINKRFSFKTKKTIVEAIVSDDSGSMQVTWFNQPYIANMYKAGDLVVLSGKATQYKKLQFINPVHEKFSEQTIHTGRLVPLYRLPETLYDKTFRRFIAEALPLAPEIRDPVPAFIQQQFRILPLGQAIEQMHFPDNPVSLQKAKERLIFEEILIQQLAVQLHKKELAALPSYQIPADAEYIKSITNTLPFSLTNGQKRTIWDMVQSMGLPHPKNRLLEGDVGSGKTLVAFITMLHTTHAGFQTVLLAPTEILAQQHYESLQKVLSKLPLKPTTVLLTRNFAFIDGGKVTTSEAKKILAQDEPVLAIGTHALLHTKDTLPHLALIVIDEQHRFGVEQRASLQKKAGIARHLLSMSATPIPRTLALSLYGDLEISRLTEMPKGRQPIATFVVPEQKRNDSYEFIKKEIKSGRQVFIITPLVEDSTMLQTKAAKSEFERLKKEVFKGYSVALVYGGLKGMEKEAVMNDFASGKTNILVATSVVEVGVDVPNASVMIIEGAERFGLAQLHQLRGRVGRGAYKSYCLLFTSTNNPTSLERLQEFAQTRDGFLLAEKDLEQRGFGNLFGQEQSGFHFKFSEYLTLKTLQIGKEAAEILITKKEKEAPLLFKEAKKLLPDIHLE